jgi:hypothetical protein
LKITELKPHSFCGSNGTIKQLAEKLAWTQLGLCPFQNGARQYFGVNPE